VLGEERERTRIIENADFVDWSLQDGALALNSSVGAS
jgi:hypothetical protein